MPLTRRHYAVQNREKLSKLQVGVKGIHWAGLHIRSGESKYFYATFLVRIIRIYTKEKGAGYLIGIPPLSLQLSKTRISMQIGSSADSRWCW
jgi:hypothetical protein